MTFYTKIKAAAFAAGISLAAIASPAMADEQYFPLQSYRVGPYAAGGTGFFGGFIDYLNLINIRDGGINGVKLHGPKPKPSTKLSEGSRLMNA